MSVIEYSQTVGVTGLPVFSTTMPIDMSISSGYFTLNQSPTDSEPRQHSQSTLRPNNDMIYPINESNAHNIRIIHGHPSFSPNPTQHQPAPPRAIPVTLCTLNPDTNLDLDLDPSNTPRRSTDTEAVVHSPKRETLHSSFSTEIPSIGSSNSPSSTQYTHLHQPHLKGSLNLSDSFPPMRYNNTYYSNTTRQHSEQQYHRSDVHRSFHQIHRRHIIGKDMHDSFPNSSLTPPAENYNSLEVPIEVKRGKEDEDSNTVIVSDIKKESSSNQSASEKERERFDHFPPAKRFIRSLGASPLDGDKSNDTNEFAFKDKMDKKAIIQITNDPNCEKDEDIDMKHSENKEVPFQANSDYPIPSSHSLCGSSFSSPVLSPSSTSPLSSSLGSSLFPMTFMAPGPLYKPAPEPTFDFLKRRHSTNSTTSPIVVDSSIPFTTYLHNLTLTLQQSAAATLRASKSSSCCETKDSTSPRQDGNDKKEPSSRLSYLLRQVKRKPGTRIRLQRVDNESPTIYGGCNEQDSEEPSLKRLKEEFKDEEETKEDYDVGKDDNYDEANEICVDGNNDDDEDENEEKMADETNAEVGDYGSDTNKDVEKEWKEYPRSNSGGDELLSERDTRENWRRRRCLSDRADVSEQRRMDISPISSIPSAFLHDIHHHLRTSLGTDRNNTIGFPLSTSIIASQVFPVSQGKSSVVGSSDPLAGHLHSPFSYHQHHQSLHKHQQEQIQHHLQQQQQHHQSHQPHPHHHHQQHHHHHYNPLSPPHGLSALTLPPSLPSPRSPRESHPHLPAAPVVQVNDSQINVKIREKLIK